jgi:hypothetical protein
MYNSVVSDYINFEILFAGPRKASFKPPKNSNMSTQIFILCNVEKFYKKSESKYTINIGVDFALKQKAIKNFINRIKLY